MNELMIEENVSLAEYNTFGIPANARYLVRLQEEHQLKTLLTLPVFTDNPLLVLGGGSNVLFTGSWPGLVLKVELKGITTVFENEREVWVKSAAGESWHGLVMWSVNRGLGGLENMSLIPGCCGAAPMQNIGAYGTELKDVFVELEAIALSNGAKKIFKKEECDFGYRESVFKKEQKGKYLITSIKLRLQKFPKLNTAYGDIQAVLTEQGQFNPGVKDISDAVIRIRQSKLPDPAVLGNAGSFFKNPVVPRAQADALLQQYPLMPVYPTADPDWVKVAAGWLIEQCGWKGKRVGQCGAHARQALVLVNYGGAKGEEVLNLSDQIIQSVKDKFRLDLEREVNVI